MNFCPSEETLRRFGTSALDERDGLRFDKHIDGCPRCQAVLDQFVLGSSTAKFSGEAWMPGPADFPVIPGFVIESELGRGGMGVVYRATETRLERQVALKILAGGSSVGTREQERWLREARSVGRVQHPLVVPLYQAGEANGWLYLVLEYVPGGSLEQRLRGPIPVRDAACLLESIALAVEAVHHKGLLHLDLKPSNILLDSAPDAPWERAAPKVADFGIARPRDEPEALLERLAGPLGTPAYMAPEQVSGDRSAIGPAADVYALGAILYELLTGAPPFQAVALTGTLRLLEFREPVSPRTLLPGLPRDLETICLVCLRKDPTQRYPSALAVAEDLRRWSEGRPIRERPLSGAERAWRWRRRHPSVAALITALSVAITTGIVGLLVLLDRAEIQRRRAGAEHAQAADARRRAEDYEQFSAQASDELVGLIRHSVDHATVASQDEILVLLRKLRDSTLALRRQGVVPNSTLSGLEREIASGLISLGKLPEAKDVLDVTVVDLRKY